MGCQPDKVHLETTPTSGLGDWKQPQHEWLASKEPQRKHGSGFEEQKKFLQHLLITMFKKKTSAESKN